MIVHLDQLNPRDRYAMMISSILPRPIALVSTLSRAGIENLAPFSFFNGVCAKPPLVSVSIGRKSGARPKDTLTNIEDTGELVIHLVTEAMAEAMVVTSGDWAPEVSEFDKAGFGRLASEVVKPPRVAESPLAMECRLHTIVPTGDPMRTEDGRDVPSNALVLAEILVIHVDDRFLDATGLPDPTKLKPLGRLGGINYAGLSEVQRIARPVI